ncbi:MAG: NAD(P)H-hydrate dehydratase [Actinomycetota bacterium]
MIHVLTAADVKRQDAAAEWRGISVDQLMRSAGAAAASAAAKMLGMVYGARVVVVCGKGNNGGDGFVAARFLARRGAKVTVIEAGESRDAALRARNAFGGRVREVGALGAELSRADLAIDALLGVGLTRAPGGVIGEAIRLLAGAPCSVLSIDVPSGLDSDAGHVPGDAVRASRTITFGGYKPGLLFAGGAALAGGVHVADIGIPPDLRRGTAISLERDDVAGLLPARDPGANKYRSGVALLACGSRAMPGAAALVGGASVATGAGLTILTAPASVCAIAVERSPEIVTVPLDDGFDGVFNDKGLDAVREKLERASALAIGPGLTRHRATMEAVRTLVQEAAVPVVLDADGLNAFEGSADALARRIAPTILTPHEGEFERLAGRPVESRLTDAQALARTTNAVVLLKGAGTVVASPDGRLAVNVTGGARLASAGTGDVLTGVIVALLARGLDPFDAAAAGAFLHGAAADSLHSSTPSATDVLGALPRTLGAIA